MNALFHRGKMRRLAVLLLAAGTAAGAHADDSRFTSRTSTANASGADVYGHSCQGAPILRAYRDQLLRMPNMCSYPRGVQTTNFSPILGWNIKKPPLIGGG